MNRNLKILYHGQLAGLLELLPMATRREQRASLAHQDCLAYHEKTIVLHSQIPTTALSSFWGSCASLGASSGHCGQAFFSSLHDTTKKVKKQEKRDFLRHFCTLTADMMQKITRWQ
ncbi:MAG: hypothetical protein IKM79_01165 [Bacteroidales bacterium]|nr:hypothetical protein [Bacteroidales bacterium]